MHATQKLAYDLFLMFWRFVVSIFFREIRPRGAFNIPRDGPLILVAAPHCNQFLDPILLMSETFRETRRRVQCLSAAASLQRKVVGFFIAMQGAIPVTRAQDSAKPGTGTITLSEDDPCLVIGTSTKFLTELAPKKQLMLPKSLSTAKAEVLEIISDTQVRLKKEFSTDNGKATSKIRAAIEKGERAFSYKVLPFLDQKEMYGRVYKTLKEGGCIGIFPEGGSHDRTDLLPLKAGVTIMALGAMSNNPSLRVRIVPVGLSYFHPHRFRSRAVVEFGGAMDVPPELVRLFSEGGEKKREACGKLMDMIYDGLRSVTLRTPDYDTLMLIQAARRLYKTPGEHLTLGQVVELNKRFMQGYEHFKDEPRIQRLRDNVLKYNRLVRDLGLRDHQVPRARKAAWKTLGLLLYRMGLLLVWSALALPGVIVNAPIFLLASTISRRKAKEALAASSVKIAGRDVLATWKILVSIVLVPILYLFYASLATWVASQSHAPLQWRIAVFLSTLVVLPIIAYGALKFGEAGIDVLKSLRPLIVSVFPGQQKHLDKLKLMRLELANELTEVVNEFGPQLWDDFDKWRILVPSASVPPSSDTTGLWRRKTSVGQSDAPGNLLAHPMTWLDERLFGWSKSGRRLHHSSASSRSATPSPNASDDEEDAGDYDDIAGLVRSYEDVGVGAKLRSARSSYADLQQLRMSNSNLNLSSNGVGGGAGVPSPISPTS